MILKSIAIDSSHWVLRNDQNLTWCFVFGDKLSAEKSKILALRAPKQQWLTKTQVSKALLKHALKDLSF